MSDISRNWSSVASSSDGTTLVAGVDNGYLYLYTKISNSWSARMNNLSRNWSSVASSSDGTKLVAGVYNGYLYTSTDFGFNWSPRMTDLSRNWSSVTSSSDGANLFATVMSGKIYTSNDYGQNWIANDLSRNWSSITSSRTTLISSVNDGYLYILKLITYYNKNKTDLASSYIRREDLLSIQPNSQSLTLNSGGFKTNNVLIDKTFSFYKYGTRKNSFFKAKNVDIGSLFQISDVSYVYINITTPIWSKTSTTFTNAKWIWSNSLLPTQQRYAQVYKYWFYYTFYYTQPDISGNIYGISNNATEIYFNSPNNTLPSISNVNNGVWSTPSLTTTSSVRIKKGLNHIKIGVYNNTKPLPLIGDFDASLNVTSSSNKVSRWTSINTANYLQQTTLTSRPVITQNFINSYPAINFGDVSGSLLQTNTTKTSVTDITLFFVIKLTGHKQQSQFCSTNGIWKSGSLHLIFQQNTTLVTSKLKISFYAGTDNSYNWVTPLIVPTNSPYILTINISNSVAKYRYNGIPEETTYTYGDATNILADLDIGGWSQDASRNFLGGIGEFIQYNRTLSLIEMQQAEYYLGLKWGISSFYPSVQSVSIGLHCYYYNNYYFDTSFELFNTRPYILYNKNITNFSNPSYAISNTYNTYQVPDYSTYMWYGLFKSPYSYSTDISFGLSTDDASYMWFGDNAKNENYTKANANIDNSGIHAAREKQCSINVVNDIYYPIRIIYGQRIGGRDFSFHYMIPQTNTKVYDLSNVVFYQAYSTGLYCYLYNNYYFDTSFDLFSSRPYTLYNRNITNFVSTSTAILNTDLNFVIQNYSTYMWYGLFKSPYSSPTDISFGLNTDDASYMWFGDNAMDGKYTLLNANIDNSGIKGPPSDKQCNINVKNDVYYPIRIIYGQRGGNDEFQFYYIIPQTTTKVYDLSNVVFYPSKPDGLIVSVYDTNNNCIAYTNENWTYSITDPNFSNSATNSIDDPYYFNEEAIDDPPPE